VPAITDPTAPRVSTARAMMVRLMRMIPPRHTPRSGSLRPAVGPSQRRLCHVNCASSKACFISNIRFLSMSFSNLNSVVIVCITNFNAKTHCKCL
jgi:hypothetical protein